MGSASLRKSRVLALSLAAVVGTMTLAVSPVLAAPAPDRSPRRPSRRRTSTPARRTHSSS
ncbi:hypothetical protein PJ267_20015 [Arthrobacter sp. OVS8]|nr:hypothetical protein PJ267_20015 [Arthrobacter sp. OVS8]